jgi:hypothetical protein
VLGAIANPKFKFAEIESTADRQRFLERFQTYSVKASAPKKSKSATSAQDARTPYAPAATGSVASEPVEDAPSNPKRRPKRDSLDRPTLAPKSGPGILPVVGKRLNPLYRECREIEVDGHENAAAFLLRVFIELSSEAFAIALKLPRTQWMKDKGIKTWDTRGVRLDDKVGAVIQYLDPAAKDRRLDQARLALDHKTPAYYSISTLHGYFHNREFIPAARDIKSAWDAWESYLLAIHERLSQP